MRAICYRLARDHKPLVLKGGAALMLGYGLKRLSQDLDFDLTADIKTHLNIESVLKATVSDLRRIGMAVHLVGVREPKKTETTHRVQALFRLPGRGQPWQLKIEISSRALPDLNDLLETPDGLVIYTLNHLAEMKLAAAAENETNTHRTAARDLHDLAFIVGAHAGDLSAATISKLQAFFSDLEGLALRYEPAYESDPFLKGRLYQDMAVAERWMNQQIAGHPPPFVMPPAPKP